MEKFEIHQAYDDDTFGNIARLHREKIKEMKLEIHKIVRITNTKTKDTVYAHLRTLEGEYKKIKEGTNWIRIDEDLRNKLKVNFSTHEHKEEKLVIVYASIFGKIRYSLNHSNPVVKYPSWIALVLGSISIFVGILPYLSQIINWILSSIF